MKSDTDSFGGKPPKTVPHLFSTVLSFSSTPGTATETLYCMIRKDHTAISTEYAYLEMADKANHKRNVFFFFFAIFNCLQCFVPLNERSSVGGKAPCLIYYDCRLQKALKPR